MIDLTFKKLIESLASKTPTPGGGAAAALAACMGTSLFVMVVRFSRGKKANVAREPELGGVETKLCDLLARLMPMADRDCQSFQLVLAAGAKPKATEAEQEVREQAIQEAMVGAMVVPEEVLGLVRDVFAAISPVVNCIGKLIASDLGSGAALLLAAAEGAFLNVRVNAADLQNRELADQTMVKARATRSEIAHQQATIATYVEKVLA